MDSRTKAIIRRASKNARARIHQLDKETRQQLRALYRQARDDIERMINGAESLDGTIKLESMQRLRQQLDRRLLDMDNTRDQYLVDQMRIATNEGVNPFLSVGGSFNQIAENSLRQTINFVGGDGLQLSDRLWRLNQHERDIIANKVEQAIVRGDSATRAAREFLTQSLDIPADIQRKMGQAQAMKIANATGLELMKKGSPYQNALRLFRTEINRAHGEAYEAAAFESPDVIGTKFLLSPNHPETDICDMHAKVNRYGLGPGVYPKGKNPWPAHPNTLSFTVVVFADEVTAADRAGKQTRIEWLKQQPPSRQQQVLNGRKKRAALAQGILKENQIATPWKTLRKRYQRQGIDVDNLTVQQIRVSHEVNPSLAGLQPSGVKVSSVFDPLAHANVMDHATSAIDKVHGDGKLPVIPIRETTSRGFYGWYVRDNRQRHIALWSGGDHKALTAVHEIGHFIDHQGLPGNGMSSVRHKKLDGWRTAIAESDSVQQLVKMYDSTTDRGMKNHLKYLLVPEELWARSYAQYITGKSGDNVLKQQLDRLRHPSDFGDVVPRQWPDADFKSIESAIDKLFQDLEWIV